MVCSKLKLAIISGKKNPWAISGDQAETSGDHPLYSEFASLTQNPGCSPGTTIYTQHIEIRLPESNPSWLLD